MIQQSSGTTGQPKTIERTWSEISQEIASYNRCIDLAPTVTPVIACSITHSYGLICGVLASLQRGVIPHVVTSWNPKYVLRVLALYPEPLLYSAPAFIHSLVQLLPGDTRLYGAMTSGTVLPAQWFDTIRGRVHLFLQQYGCSEAGCVSIAKNPVTANAIGRPLPHLQLHLAPPPAGEAAAHAPGVGELRVRLAEREVFTQDLAYQDPAGDWYFCSRLDDTIIVSGVNVYPTEVENVLAQLPGVQEVVVFRKQDELAGQRVAALYTADSEIPAAVMRAWSARFLARHQWPSHWIQVPEIPRLNNGKISRRQLAVRDFTTEAVAP